MAHPYHNPRSSRNAAVMASWDALGPADLHGTGYEEDEQDEPVPCGECFGLGEIRGRELCPRCHGNG